MSTSLVLTDSDAMWRVAERIGRDKHDLVPERISSTSAAYATILAGAELGLPPMESLRSIHIVKGKVTLAAEAQLAICGNAGIEWQWLETTPTKATIKLMRASRLRADKIREHTHTFTIEEARAAGLLQKKGPWHTYPAAMLRARAASAGIRAFCPDVLTGCYVEGELTESIEVEHTPEARQEEAPRSPDGPQKAQHCSCGDVCTREPNKHVSGPAWRRLMARLGAVGVSYDDVKRLYAHTGKHLLKSMTPDVWNNLGNALEDPERAQKFRDAIDAITPLEEAEVISEADRIEAEYEADERAAIQGNYDTDVPDSTDRS